MGIELEIPTLLEPIPGEHPTGVDLREDDDPNNIFRRIKDARNDARQEETQADLGGEGSPEALRLWREVWKEGIEYLKSQAKDLEIAAYMIEASIRIDGFRGFATSLELTTELVSRFWGELLPTPDEDGIETTILPISRLNGDVISYPLMRISVTADSSLGELVVWQYVQAQQIEQLDAEERDIRTSRGAFTLDQFQQAVAETPAEFYVPLYQDLLSAREQTASLERAFEAVVGDEHAPNLSRFEKSISEAESILQQIAGDKLTVKEDLSDEEFSGQDDQDASASGSAGRGRSQEGISSREDAFEQLEVIAKWIEEHEPQSLLPPEIRKVIRRGKMTPHDLYQDLITDDDTRRTLYKDVGIEVSEDDR